MLQKMISDNKLSAHKERLRITKVLIEREKEICNKTQEKEILKYELSELQQDYQYLQQQNEELQQENKELQQLISKRAHERMVECIESHNEMVELRKENKKLQQELETCELVEMLVKREGVEELQVNVYEKASVTVAGACRVLVVSD